MTDIIINARPRLKIIVGRQIRRRYQRYDRISTSILLEIILMIRAMERITISRLRKSLSIPVVLPLTYSKLDIERVYRTSFVSSFLSRFRKSAARKMTINAWPIFKRYRLI